MLTETYHEMYHACCFYLFSQNNYTRSFNFIAHTEMVRCYLKFSYFSLLFMLSISCKDYVILPLGLEDSTIPRDIYAPTDAGGYHGQFARLNNEKAWCIPQGRVNNHFDKSIYLEIRFAGVLLVDIIRLQGYRHYGYGKQIRLTYKPDDGGVYEEYRQNNQRYINVLNRSGNHTEDLILNPPILGKSIRIYLQFGVNHKCLRMELYAKIFVANSGVRSREKEKLPPTEEERSTGSDGGISPSESNRGISHSIHLRIGLICCGVLIVVIFLCIAVQYNAKRRRNIVTKTINIEEVVEDEVHVPSVSMHQETPSSLAQSYFTATDFPSDSRRKKRFSSHVYVSLSSFILRKFSGGDSLRKAKKNCSHKHSTNSYLKPVDSPNTDLNDRDSNGYISTNEKARYEISLDEAFQSDDNALNPINEDDFQDVFYNEEGEDMEVERYQSLTSIDSNRYAAYIKQ